MNEIKNIKAEVDKRLPKFKGKIIPITIVCNDKYAKYASTVVASAVENIKHTDNLYMFYILSDSLTDSNIIKLEKMSKSNTIVQCINLSQLKNMTSSLYKINNRFWTYDIFYKLFIPEIFSVFEKVIYLDCDIIVNCDIAELYDLTSKYDNEWTIACAKDCLCDSNSDRLKIKNNEYMNVGVVVFNNKPYTKLKIREKAIELYDSKHHPYPEQDVLNVVCESSKQILPFKWNFQRLYDILASQSVRDEYMSNISNPKIIHYVNFKPWEIQKWHDLSNYYFRYISLSPFAEEIISNMAKTGIDTINESKNELVNFKKSCTNNMYLCISDLVNYYLKQKDLLIIMAIRDSVNTYWQKFSTNVNCTLIPKLGFRESYIAVVDTTTNDIYQQQGNSPSLISYEFNHNDKEIKIQSHGYIDNVHYATIKIDNINYSLNNIGLNIVIYDKKTQKVIDYVSANLFSDELMLCTSKFIKKQII